MLRLRSRGTSFLGSVDVPNLKRKALNSWAAVQDTYFSTKDTFERHKVVFTVGTSIASVATAWFALESKDFHGEKEGNKLCYDCQMLMESGNFEGSVKFFKEIRRRLPWSSTCCSQWVETSNTKCINVGTGYSLRHYHESKVDQRLESIENTMRNSHHLEHADFKKLVDPGHSRAAAWVATAGTALIVGYGLGWRGGTWYANRKFRREQLKLLGQIKPKRWQLLGQMKPRGWQFRFLRSSPRCRGPESASKTSGTMLKSAPTSRESVEAHQ
ncbi:hypothetical protein GOBAR_DD20674 [Gossypium barbadense]|nr:hypothetical protein GOBAR_DD20674 [Gossypium barbadense]